MFQLRIDNSANNIDNKYLLTGAEHIDMLIGSDSYKYKINTSVMSLLKCGQSGLLLACRRNPSGINANRDPEETGNKHWEMENRKS